MKTVRNTNPATSFIKYLASVLDISPPVKVRQYPHASLRDALYGDMMRIGNDMQHVIDRKNRGYYEKSTQK